MGFLPNNSTGFRSMSSLRGAFRSQAGDAVCGCNHPVASNYNPSATANDGSCEFVFGCTIPMADNYNPSAAMEDGSCQGDFDFPTYSGSMGQNITFDSYADYMSTYNQGMYASFNVTYPVDEVCTLGGSLGDQDEAGGGVLTGGTGVNYDPDDPTGVNYAGGCTDPNAMNYDSSAEFDDGSCIFMGGCTSVYADNYNPEAQYDDGSCVFPVIDYGVGESSGGASSWSGTYIGGCTNYEAMNFNPAAHYDDGSCEFQGGCMDVNANNYDPSAVYDNGSCDFSGTLGGGVGTGGYDPIGPTGPNVGDLLDQLAADAGGSTTTTSSGNSGGMLTNSGASFEKDPKGKQSKKPKKKFSGFAGRDAEGFFIGASPSQPYVGASGGRMCSCAGCGHINIDADPFTGMGQLACARCCKGQQSGFRGACGCGA